MEEKVLICPACGQRIGGPGSAENVYTVRHVRLLNGCTGWVPLHMRCAASGAWPSAAAMATPPGRPLELQMLHAEGDEDGV